MIWWGMKAKSRAKAKADLALVAPTEEELDWWATQKRRHMRQSILLAAAAWLVVPALWLLLPHHVPRRGWAHATWMFGATITYYSWIMWRAGEPRVCASEIRGRRLRRALAASRDAVPSMDAYRQPVRLIAPDDA